MQKILYLIDGSCYIFRYFFGIPQTYNSNGIPTNILWGYCNMLQKITSNKDEKLKESLSSFINIDHCQQFITVAFDTGREKSFRKEIYNEYKSNRVEAPDDLKIQCCHLPLILKTFKINSTAVTSFEADDVIATYTEIALQNNFDYVVVFSCDKDLMQLVSENIFVYDPFKSLLYNEEKVYDKFQVKPSQIVDYLSLVGDASDNIPGVPGIGPKTASKFLNLYSDMNGIFNNIDNLNPQKHKNALIKNQDIIYISRRLARLNKEVPVDVMISNLELQKTDIKEVKSLYKQYDLRIKI